MTPERRKLVLAVITAIFALLLRVPVVVYNQGVTRPDLRMSRQGLSEVYLCL